MNESRRRLLKFFSAAIAAPLLPTAVSRGGAERPVAVKPWKVFCPGKTTWVPATSRDGVENPV